MSNEVLVQPTENSNVVEVTAVTHVKYPSIEQFRTIVKQVRDQCGWHGVPLPTLKFCGTVKLHGTNASVVSDGINMWHQSRERIITPLSDNAGFSQYATFHREFFDVLLTSARNVAGIYGTDTKLGIYGEWCGGNIQSGIGINGLPKMFVIFGISYGEENARVWLNKDQRALILHDLDSANERKIYSIDQFPSWEMDIDFANPEMSQNKLIELTIAVEDQCPVAKQLGQDGIGEGIVWQCVAVDVPFPVGGLRFKVKGEKHSVSKVKTLAEVDVVKVANIAAFVERTVTENRLAQMKAKLTEMELDADDVRNIGIFLKYVGQDIVKEESDTLEASGITTKEVMGRVSTAARNWFLANIGK